MAGLRICASLGEYIQDKKLLEERNMFYRLYTGDDGQSHMDESYEPPEVQDATGIVVPQAGSRLLHRLASRAAQAIHHHAGRQCRDRAGRRHGLYARPRRHDARGGHYRTGAHDEGSGQRNARLRRYSAGLRIRQLGGDAACPRRPTDCTPSLAPSFDGLAYVGIYLRQLILLAI